MVKIEKKNKSGFTLIELIVVIAMIGIITAIAVPNIQQWVDKHRINASADTIRSLFERAKTEAIKNQTNVAVSFTTGTRAYIVFQETGQPNEIYDTGERVILSGNIDKNVIIYDTDFSGNKNNVTIINQMGLSSGYAGNVSIHNSQSTIFKRVSLSNAGVTRILSSYSGNADSWID